MFQRDFIKRLIEQLGQLVAHVSGLRREGKHDEALDEIDEVLGRLVPARADLVARLDPVSAARMMRDRDTVKAYARLVFEQSEVYADRGEPDQAAAKRTRAIALYEEALRMGEHDDVLESWLAEARARANA